jgi:hypothetical protein
VILGVGRVDGDEGDVPPVLASLHRRRARRLRFVEHGLWKDVRNIVRIDRDQAYRALALDRAEPLDDGARGVAELALLRHVDGNEIAVDGALRRNGSDVELAAEPLLLDRNQPAAAGWQRAENAERAMLGAVDQLDDAAREFIVAGALDPDQRAVADAAGFTRFRPARRNDVDDGRGAMRLLIPLRRARQKLAVGVASGNVGEHHRRQRAGMMQSLPAAVDAAVVSELAQHAVERRAVGVLGAEGFGDLARGHLPAALADEGDQFVAGG